MMIEKFKKQKIKLVIIHIAYIKIQSLCKVQTLPETFYK